MPSSDGILPPVHSCLVRVHCQGLLNSLPQPTGPSVKSEISSEKRELIPSRSGFLNQAPRRLPLQPGLARRNCLAASRVPFWCRSSRDAQRLPDRTQGRPRRQNAARAVSCMSSPPLASGRSQIMTSPIFGQSTRMPGASLSASGQTGGVNSLYQIGGPSSVQLALKLVF